MTDRDRSDVKSIMEGMSVADLASLLNERDSLHSQVGQLTRERDAERELGEGASPDELSRALYDVWLKYEGERSHAVGLPRRCYAWEQLGPIERRPWHALADLFQREYQRGKDDLRAAIDAQSGPAVGDDPVAIARRWNGDSGTREPDFDMNPDDTASFLAGHVIELAKERDEALREADRWRHGNTIEGDHVCPVELERDALRAERDKLQAHHDRVVAQRNSDWDGLVTQIALAIGTDEEREGAELGEIEEFDPWHALRQFMSNRPLDLDDYEAVNLLWLLRVAREIGLDTGDWLGQLLNKLKARGHGEIREPNSSSRDTESRLDGFARQRLAAIAKEAKVDG